MMKSLSKSSPTQKYKGVHVCVCALVPRRQQPAEPDSLPTGPAEEEAVLWAVLLGHQLRALPSWVGDGKKDTITHRPPPPVSPTDRLLPFSNKSSLSVCLFFRMAIL